MLDRISKIPFVSKIMPVSTTALLRFIHQRRKWQQRISCQEQLDAKRSALSTPWCTANSSTIPSHVAICDNVRVWFGSGPHQYDWLRPLHLQIHPSLVPAVLRPVQTIPCWRSDSCFDRNTATMTKGYECFSVSRTLPNIVRNKGIEVYEIYAIWSYIVSL